MTPKVVLVVDDDEDVRESICDVLAMAGHRSVGAADGRAALELLHTRRFDLIVTDLQMPGMDGWQLLSALEATLAISRYFITLNFAHQGGAPIVCKGNARALKRRLVMKHIAPTRCRIAFAHRGIDQLRVRGKNSSACP